MQVNDEECSISMTENDRTNILTSDSGKNSDDHPSIDIGSNSQDKETTSNIIDVSISPNGRASIIDDVDSECDTKSPTATATSNNGIMTKIDQPSDETTSHESDRQTIPRRDHQHGNETFVEEPRMRKLFIGGLDYKTTEETLRQHFEKFGEVIECTVKREPQTKKSRGFGFVTYAKSYMLDKAQEARPHRIDGREVEPKRAIPREESGKLETQATVKKIFLGGLTEDLTESDLKDYFKEFGNIVNISIATQKDTGKKRGFAFVEFDDYDPVDKIVLKKHHLVKETRLEVKKAIPKIEMDARRGVDPRMPMSGQIAVMNFHPQSRDIRSMRGGGYIWENGPYPSPSYPINYPTQPSYGYQSHYQSPSHYDAANWMVYGHGSSASRTSYGSTSHHRGYTSTDTDWISSEHPSSHNGHLSAQGVGPMRVGYQHRRGPYAPSGPAPYRNRSYNK